MGHRVRRERFDEVNLIRKGRNYGWPEVEGRGSTDGGRFTNPVVTWRTSEASPSGAAIRRARSTSARCGARTCWRAAERRNAPKLSPLLQDRYGRIRTVARAPDGSLWITTSNRDGRGSPVPSDDRVLRLR